jgi:hypothetical protein
VRSAQRHMHCLPGARTFRLMLKSMLFLGYVFLPKAKFPYSVEILHIYECTEVSLDS